MKEFKDDYTVPEITADEERRAALQVCTISRGREDARMLLEMLGLVDPREEEEFDLCQRGRHQLTPQNTLYSDVTNHRYCRECHHPEGTVSREEAAKDPEKYCPHGHLRTPENRRASNGRCLPCNLRQSKEHHDRKRAAGWVKPRRETCSRGHRWDEVEYTVRRDGRRVCGDCLTMRRSGTHTRDTERQGEKP